MTHTTRLAAVLGAFLYAFVWAVPGEALAGAWTVPRNRWYAEYYWRWYYSKKTYDERRNLGRRPKTALFTDIRNEFKLEYGLTDWWNLLASVPYQSSHYRDDNVDLLNAGVGDIYVRNKFRLIEDPVVSSLLLSWKIPSAYDPHESPGLGDGQVDFETRLQLSRAVLYGPLLPQHRSLAQHRAALPTPPQAAPPASRDQAIDEAVRTTELYQRSLPLVERAEPREASRWLRGVLESSPPHEPAERVLEDWAPSAEAAVPPEPAESAPAPAEPEALTMERSRVAFFNLESGVNWRNEEPANEVPFVFEAGFTPLRRLMVVGSWESVVSIRSTSEAGEDFGKWGLRAILNLWGDGFVSVFRTGGPTVNIEVGYTDIVAGRNTADAYELFGKLAVFY